MRSQSEGGQQAKKRQAGQGLALEQWQKVPPTLMRFACRGGGRGGMRGQGAEQAINLAQSMNQSYSW